MQRVLAAGGVLVVLLGVCVLTGLSSARTHSSSSYTRSTIAALEVALAMYHADHREYPRGQVSDPYTDQAVEMHEALTRSGKNAPYIEYSSEQVGGHPFDGSLVPLDPWGSPYHYREWLSRKGPESYPVEHARQRLPGVPRLANAIKHKVVDTAHDLDGYDIWSNGPNGINEYGAPCSDDITSWDQDDDWANACSGCTTWAPPPGFESLGAIGALGLFIAGCFFGSWWLNRSNRHPPGKRPPRRSARCYAAHVRCVWCHDADGQPMAACGQCRTLLHPECWQRMRRCPTLGCDTSQRRPQTPIVIRLGAAAVQ